MLLVIFALATGTVYIPAKGGKKIVQLHEIASQVWRNILLHQTSNFLRWPQSKCLYSVSSDTLIIGKSMLV